MTDELQIKTAVLILQYDAENDYGLRASERVRLQLGAHKEIVELTPDVFLLNFEESFQFLTGLLIAEDRMFASAVSNRHLHLLLIPCQSPVVGSLTEELKTKLAALGLKHWEIGYPIEPRQGGK